MSDRSRIGYFVSGIGEDCKVIFAVVSNTERLDSTWIHMNAESWV